MSSRTLNGELVEKPILPPASMTHNSIVRWACLLGRAQEVFKGEAYLVDVSERKEGKNDGGNGWTDIKATSVGVCRCSESALGQYSTFRIARSPLKHVNSRPWFTDIDEGTHRCVTYCSDCFRCDRWRFYGRLGANLFHCIHRINISYRAQKSLTFCESDDPYSSLLRPSVKQVLRGGRDFANRHDDLEGRELRGKTQQSWNIVNLHKDDGQVRVIHAMTEGFSIVDAF